LQFATQNKNNFNINFYFANIGSTGEIAPGSRSFVAPNLRGLANLEGFYLDWKKAVLEESIKK